MAKKFKKKLKLLRRLVYRLSIFRFRRTVPLPKLCEDDKNTLEGELTVHKCRQRFSKRSAIGSPLGKTVLQLSFMFSSLSSWYFAAVGL